MWLSMRLVRDGASCITRHDLERLVGNVDLLNQVDQDGSNEPEYKESSTKSKPEANSINETEEVETEEEPNSPESRVKPNVAEPVEPSFNPELIMPTSSNTMKNS
ncbi:hypothetical protein PVK06_026753 [Gossypium arboreum]|uniref:Uncharacterized protein n=1 Tax=Gossypium arboreum TaxID=29729 RepID=A0ABR0P100_GOSAR|nr:hypothetical protein PVK06_026753 [Gossypium arboreum]